MSDDDWALQALARAPRLHDWMFSLLTPTRPGPMLEVGAGIGTFSRRLLDAGASSLVLVEPNERQLRLLEGEVGSDSRVEIIRESLPGSPTLRGRQKAFSYALAQNVLEHIDDDVAALVEVVESLQPEGELAVLVPAHPRLYGRLDREFGHARRYTRESLCALVAAAGAEVQSIRSFNLLGVPGWLAADHSRAVNITPRTLAIYETFVPTWRRIESFLRPSVGLSLIVRARKA